MPIKASGFLCQNRSFTYLSDPISSPRNFVFEAIMSRTQRGGGVATSSSSVSLVPCLTAARHIDNDWWEPPIYIGFFHAQWFSDSSGSNAFIVTKEWIDDYLKAATGEQWIFWKRGYFYVHPQTPATYFWVNKKIRELWKSNIKGTFLIIKKMGRNYDVGIITDPWDNYSGKLKITLHQNFRWAK